MIDKIDKIHHEKFGVDPEVIIKSPGRINLIGEHTDYNDGFVLPAAINYYMYLAISKNETDTINLFSIDYDAAVSENIYGIERTDNGWLNLLNGVIFQLKDKITGIDISFSGDVPEGAGVSSSAALCCGMALGLSELFDLELDKWSLAKIAQKSEHDFALVQCGIMDQFACLFGSENHVLMLNCLDLSYQETLIDLSGYKFLLLNSNVKHNLGDSDYNKRRDESNNALDYIKSKFTEVKTYQDVSSEMIESLEDKLDAVLLKRASYISSENERVIELNKALNDSEINKVGKILSEGHNGLKNLYEVTCEETDFIVNELLSNTSVSGARQVGGGFGGCVLALIEESVIDTVIENLKLAYRNKFNLELDKIPVKISAGCSRIK